MPGEIFAWLCQEQTPVRRDLIAEVRTRVASGQWPEPLAVADAILRRSGIAA